MIVSNVFKNYARKQATPLKLQTVYNFNKTKSTNKIINQSKFVYDEMLIRLSHRVFDLLKLPYGLPTIKPIKEVIDLYTHSFDRIKTSTRPQTETQSEDLSELLVDIKNQHQYLEENISEGLQILNKNYGHHLVDYDLINFELDKFFSSRIGIRTLITLNHYFMNDQKLIQECNLLDLINKSAQEVQYIYQSNYDQDIGIEIKPYRNRVTIPYIPSHITFVIREILKNSAVAHYINGVEENIKVSYTEGKDDIIIKISDQGLGFSYDQLNKMFSYSYTTTPIEAPDEMGLINKPIIAGYGYGLPLSRIYCKYFVGNLFINPLENIGTDAIIYINKIGEENFI